MCESMADIQSATAENRRGKEKMDRRQKKKPQDKNIMSALFHRAAITITMDRDMTTGTEDTTCDMLQ